MRGEACVKRVKSFAFSSGDSPQPLSLTWMESASGYSSASWDQYLKSKEQDLAVAPIASGGDV